jgi:hypothetical protein
MPACLPPALLEEVNLDNANAACFVLAAHLGRVLPGRERSHERGFERIAWLQSHSFQLLLLLWVCLPIIVLYHERAILVS